MNIKTLRVQNFRNFEDKTFEFSEGFNLIIGDNGAGKTALLEAMVFLLDDFMIGLEESINSSRKYKYITSGNNRVKTFHHEGSLTIEVQTPLEITADFEISDQKFRHLNGVYRGDNLPEITIGMFEAHNLKGFSKNLSSQIRSGETVIAPIIAYYSTARLWLKKQEDNQTLIFDEEVLTPSSRLKAYENSLDIGINNKSWLRWFMRMELISLQNKKPMKVFEAVKKAVQTCLDGCELLNFDVQRGEPIARIHSNTLPFSLLSDGQRSMLAMVADIAYRMAQLNPHLLENVTLETPGVVLIDELDLHLHPKWQRKVVDNLRKAFPKVQFFATSHSPFIIQSVRQGELIDLNETEGAAEYQDKSIEDIAEQVQGVYMPQRSQRELEMLAAAKEYYQVLERAKDANDAELKSLKERLDQLSEPYAEDIAYIAFLEAKRASALKDRV